MVVLLLVASRGDADSDDPGLDWLKIAIGLLFLAMAAKQWRKRPKSGEEPEEPSWMADVDSATPARAALLGAALSAANPKNLALTLAAAASIVDSDRAARPLAALKQFMAANNAVIMMVVLLLLGAKLLGDGLSV